MGRAGALQWRSIARPGNLGERGPAINYSGAFCLRGDERSGDRVKRGQISVEVAMERLASLLQTDPR